MDTHRVRRLRWRASAANTAEAFALRTLLREQGEACEAALDRAFDKAVPPHEVWHLPRLALELRLSDLRGVSAGELAGWYHDLERLDLAEEPLRFAEGGVIISRRLHTMCEAGDCLMQVAEPIGG